MAVLRLIELQPSEHSRECAVHSGNFADAWLCVGTAGAFSQRYASGEVRIDGVRMLGALW
jgi:hypothetical protein